jgi:hypothetical protein
VRYRLQGKEFQHSITEFNLALGFIDVEFSHTAQYKTAAIDFVDSFEYVSVWRTMSSDPLSYDPSNSKGAYLRKPEWVYLHRLLAFNFSGRKNTANVCTKTELYFIWSMVHRNNINLGFWLASQFHSILTNGKHLSLGFLITHLAINHGLLDLATTDLHIACDMEPLNIACLVKMKVIAMYRGTYQFQTPSVPPLRFRGDLARTQKRPRPANAPSHSSEEAEPDFGSRLAKVERQVSKMEKNLDALLRFWGVSPPCPPSP